MAAFDWWETDKRQIPLTSEWRLQEFRRMIIDDGTYLQGALDISLLHTRLDCFINTASSSDKHPYSSTDPKHPYLFNEEGFLWHGTNITNDRCYIINTPWKPENPTSQENV